MKKWIHTAAAVFLLLGAAGALFLTWTARFLPALMVLVYAAIFFAVFILTDEKPGAEAAPSPPYDRYTDYMRYCPSCGYLGSQPSGERVPYCPKCGRALIATHTQLSEFVALSEAERKKLKRRWVLESEEFTE